VFWIGSGNTIEKSLVKRWGIPYYRIPSGKLRRYFSFQNIIDIFKIGAGCIASLFILARERPKVLFSKGGFVSVPPVFAARILKIPVITHESDSDPGLATKINSRFADVICTSWEQTAAYFPKRMQRRVQCTGNPVRKEIFRGDGGKGRNLLSIDDTTPVIVVLGGSQGAKQVNDLVTGHLENLLNQGVVVHQTGSESTTQSNVPGYYTFSFIADELPHFLAAADLVVSRSGANILCELAALGKPSLLIPLGGGTTRGDQERNARMFADAGAAVILSGKNNQADTFSQTISALLADKKRLKEMGAAASSLQNKDAASEISTIILKYAGG
jgi:UDP-N-acetylglucosamine--N-acetylmuramyl-(pentapeptide) pyrophosphoryl-undecaprenol N-acetylglucosamine transferase